MGTIYQMPSAADAKIRLMVKAVNEMILQHPDPSVAKRWAALASESLARYSSPPPPSQPVLDLDSVDDLSAEQKQQLHSLTQRWLESYLEDVRDQLMNVHGDMLKLQKQIAELESASK